jgi:hypothetical protein
LRFDSKMEGRVSFLHGAPYHSLLMGGSSGSEY